MNFQASAERIGRLEQQSALRNLSVSKKKGKAATTDVAAGEELQEQIIRRPGRKR